MARSLSDFINLLKNITPNVYYQPGDKDSITYPCIVVADNYTDATYSNNIVYNTKHSYTVTYMSRKPLSIEDQMFAAFKYCRQFWNHSKQHSSKTSWTTFSHKIS